MVRKYVLTGTAYSGKTTTINRLGELGYETVPEAARIVIEEELATGGKILPWIDLPAFFKRLFQKKVELEAKISEDAPIAFLDRGFPDELAYCRLIDVEPSPAYLKAFQEHHYDGVFLLETLPGYQQDEIRKENPEMVRQLRTLHEEAYLALGYDVIVVPVLPPEERVKLIVSHVERH